MKNLCVCVYINIYVCARVCVYVHVCMHIFGYCGIYQGESCKMGISGIAQQQGPTVKTIHEFKKPSLFFQAKLNLAQD